VGYRLEGLLDWLLAFAYSFQSFTAGAAALWLLEPHLLVKLLIFDCKLEFHFAIAALEHTIFKLWLLLLLAHVTKPTFLGDSLELVSQ
jgi:hypothetical protein